MIPALLDLCCGLGGWADGFLREGWEVVGVDNADFSARYPGRFVRADLLQWEGWRTPQELLRPGSCFALVVASPPCDQFSRFSMPWTRAKNPPPPDMRLVDRCRFIAREMGLPLVLENVRGAQQFLGRSAANCGPFHLWGDVPAIIPDIVDRKKESYASRQKAERAKIPLALAVNLARQFSPLSSPSPLPQSRL